jgi:hypothetical protein
MISICCYCHEEVLKSKKREHETTCLFRNIVEEYVTRNNQVKRHHIADFLESHSSPPKHQGLDSKINLIINKIPKQNHIFIYDFDIQVDKSEDVCPICLQKFNEINERKTSIRMLRCNHMFCNRCIQIWLQKKKKCPICNQEFTETEIQLKDKIV